MVIDSRHPVVISPVAVHDVLVLVSSCEESERNLEIHFSVLICFLIEFLHGLPFGPAASDQHLFRLVLPLGLPDEVGFLSGTRSKVIVSALLANSWHICLDKNYRHTNSSIMATILIQNEVKINLKQIGQSNHFHKFVFGPFVLD